jgi:hypothetical protein
MYARQQIPSSHEFKNSVGAFHGNLPQVTQTGIEATSFYLSYVLRPTSI